MTENAILDHQTSSDSGITLQPEALEFLNSTGKWGRFLAIMGFIACGLMIIIALGAGSFMAVLSRTSGLAAGSAGMFSMIYIVIAVLYFIPCLYLWRFSTSVIQAVATLDTAVMTEAFRNIKSNFKFVGILTIVFLSFYVVIILFAIIMAAAS